MAELLKGRRAILIFGIGLSALGAASGQVWGAAAGQVSSNMLLRDQASAFVGGPVILDERLSIPKCPEPYVFELKSQLRARCLATGWTMILPVAKRMFENEQTRSPVQPTTYRRGEVVQVYANGGGYHIGMDAIVVSADSMGGRYVVKNLKSGNQISVGMDAQGRLVAHPHF